MNHWENMEPISGTFEATSDFTDWLKELKKSSIVEIDIIGLHDKTTGEKREFVAIDKVLEIIDKYTHATFLPDGSVIDSIEDVEGLRDAIEDMKGGEQE